MWTGDVASDDTFRHRKHRSKGRQGSCGVRQPVTSRVTFFKAIDMFVNKGVLPHPLEPEAYREAGFFAREMDLLFRAHWHLVGLVDDLARPGDYIACDLLGTPVLVRNVDGATRAF